MYRIDNDTAATVLPTPAAVGPKPNGYFTKGNPQTGIQATTVDDDWANAVQEEICNVITAAGVTLDKTSQTQLRDAIKILIESGAALYGASTSAANTYTATLSPAPTAYTAGQIVFIKFTNHNTGAATINLNSLGAKSIVHTDGSALNSSDIADGMIAIMSYDGTNFQLLNPNNANYITQTQSQNQSNSYAADTGAANAYAITLSPAPSAYIAGQFFKVKIANANTGASTLNVNSLGAINIVHVDGAALGANDLIAGMLALLIYDGTHFQLLNPSTYPVKGTFTPTLKFGGATTGITYTTQAGSWYSIGNLYFIVGTIVLSSKGSATGSATISGFPATSSTDTGAQQQNFITLTSNVTFTQPPKVTIGNGTTSASIFSDTSASGVTVFADTNFSNNSTLWFSGCYIRA